MGGQLCRCGEQLRQWAAPSTSRPLCRHCDQLCRIPYDLCGSCQAVNASLTRQLEETAARLVEPASVICQQAICSECGWRGPKHRLVADVRAVRGRVERDYQQHVLVVHGRWS